MLPGPRLNPLFYLPFYGQTDCMADLKRPSLFTSMPIASLDRASSKCHRLCTYLHERNKTMKKALVASITVLSLLLSGCGSSSDSGSTTGTTSKSKSKTVVDETEARLSCEDLIKNQLKSPSTASFAPRNEWTFTEVSGGYRASGWVDAQNDFGATVRNSFTCTVTEGPSDGKVYRKLDSFN